MSLLIRLCLLVVSSSNIFFMNNAYASFGLTVFGTSLSKINTWDILLSERLSSCLSVPVVVSNYSVSGGNSYDAVERMNSSPQSRADLLLIDFIINDSSLHRHVPLALTLINTRGIIDEFRRLNPSVVIVIQVFGKPVGFLNFILRPFYRRYETALRNFADSNDLVFLSHEFLIKNKDVYTIIQKPDGVHFFDSAHQIFANNIFFAVAPLLCRRDR